MVVQVGTSVSQFPPFLEDLLGLCQPEHLSSRVADDLLRSKASREIAAIIRWLSADFAPSTKRAYEKEVHRFCCWALFVASKSLSSMTRADLESYEAFIITPPRSWCGIRNRRRKDGTWRPFEGPLSELSREFAFGVLENLFSFLVDAREAVQNPVRELRRVRKTHTSPVKKPSPSLPSSTLYVLERELRAECLLYPAGSRRRLEIERMLFVVLFMASTGIRAEELIRARISDLCSRPGPNPSEKSWILLVQSEIGKMESITLNPTAAYAAWRYLAERRAPLPSDASSAPLVSRLGSGERFAPLTRDSIYLIVKKAFNFVADNIEREHSEEAARLRKATPHWLRVSYCRLAAEAGQNLPAIQQQMRHQSIATTANNAQIQSRWRPS